MKKIINILVLAILCCSLAFAGKGLEPTFVTGRMSQVYGLENAMLRTNNEEVAQHLERIMYKIQTHRREMLNRLDNLEIIEDEDENVYATGKKNGKLFGFITLQRRLKYNIDEEGNVERVRAWHEFMWKKDQDIE